MLDMNTREIMVKKPFRRICPEGYMVGGFVKEGDTCSNIDNAPVYKIVTQGDFLREYFPSGHRINDPFWYPDITRQVEEEVNDKIVKRTYVELVERCAFAFQRIIATKHLIHLCGNNIQFEITKPEPTEDDNAMFFRFKKGWLTKNMEIAWFEAAKSVKITGDTAFVGYMKGGKFYWKVLSYLNGDRQAALERFVGVPHFPFSLLLDRRGRPVKGEIPRPSQADELLRLVERVE